MTRLVNVTFLVPQLGPVVETYDLDDATDCATFDLNARENHYPVASIMSVTDGGADA